jgi:hypothetical protein
VHDYFPFPPLSEPGGGIAGLPKISGLGRKLGFDFFAAQCAFLAGRSLAFGLIAECFFPLIIYFQAKFNPHQNFPPLSHRRRHLDHLDDVFELSWVVLWRLS